MNSTVILCLLAVMPLTAVEERTRLKDLVSIEGVRDNQLVGYGIVVGLNRTGDSQQTVFSVQSLTNLLARMGVAVSPTGIKVRNTTPVIVTTDLPPFAQPGTSHRYLGGSCGRLHKSTGRHPGSNSHERCRRTGIRGRPLGSVITGRSFPRRKRWKYQGFESPYGRKNPRPERIARKLGPSIAPQGSHQTWYMRSGKISPLRPAS